MLLWQNEKKRRTRRDKWNGKELRLSAIARVQVHNDKMQSPNGGNVPFPTARATCLFSSLKRKQRTDIQT